METLIAIQTVINNIEDLTLNPKYHSKFNYLNDRRMKIETYCWQQASSYKNILDNMLNIAVYMNGNSTIEILVL